MKISIQIVFLKESAARSYQLVFDCGCLFFKNACASYQVAWDKETELMSEHCYFLRLGNNRIREGISSMFLEQG